MSKVSQCFVGTSSLSKQGHWQMPFIVMYILPMSLVFRLCCKKSTPQVQNLFTPETTAFLVADYECHHHQQSGSM